MPPVLSAKEKAWLVYVVLLLASVLYRFSSNRGFSGQSIVLPKGVRTDVNVPKRSDTHFIKLHSELMMHVCFLACVALRRERLFAVLVQRDGRRWTGRKRG